MTESKNKKVRSVCQAELLLLRTQFTSGYISVDEFNAIVMEVVHEITLVEENKND